MQQFSEVPTLLAIDDAVDCIHELRAALGSDYRLRAANSGARGLEMCLAEPPDLVLLDVMMPEMNGYEVCRRLKTTAATAHIPVMFLTSLDDAQSETHGLELGAVDFLTKPLAPAVVRSRVQSHLTLKRQALKLEALVQHHMAETVAARMDVLRCLGRAAGFRDNETGMHLLRISHVARLIALAYGLSNAQADIILQVAPLHDIGKIGVPDHILLKPGRLDAKEWEVMRRHTVIGAQIIGDHPSELLTTAKIVALSHHEHWDGTGYPNGLCGAAIPEPARIVALADVLDALLSARPYKPAWTIEDAMAQIKAESGRHFEPKSVHALIDVLPECLAIREAYRDA